MMQSDRFPHDTTPPFGGGRTPSLSPRPWAGTAEYDSARAWLDANGGTLRRMAEAFEWLAAHPLYILACYGGAWLCNDGSDLRQPHNYNGETPLEAIEAAARCRCNEGVRCPP